MRLSFVLELLLVFLFLAFAAARVIENNEKRIGRAKKPQKRQGPPNRYCACTASMCNCCRDFSLPVVPLKGPGCASIQYLQNDNMLVTMSFGDRVLANSTVSGKKPKPVCMGLPGGISQFCGRVYGISRQGEEFKACLGLELRALDDIEAALRVSCFKFGPKGVNLEAAPPVPVDDKEKEDDDDDDDYGLDDDDDDDDDDDEDDTFGLDVDDDDDDDDDAATSQDNEVDADDSADYAGFSVLGEDIFGGLFGDDDSGEKKKKKKIKTAKPVKENSTTKKPLLPNKPIVKPSPPRVTSRPITKVTLRPNKDSQKPSALVPGVIAPIPVPTNPPKAADNITLQSSTTPSNLKSTETPIESTLQMTASPTPASQLQSINTTEKTATPDIGLLQTDMAKLEAVAAIAQQDVAPTLLATPTTVAPKRTTEAALTGKQKNALPISSVEDGVDDEDDLFDGMIGQVATIVGSDDNTLKHTKPTNTQIKKKIDSTKKGNLPSSSVNAKPVKKPADDEDPIDFLTSVVGVDDDDEDENDDDDDDEEEEDSGENNSVDPAGGSNEDTKNEDDDDDDEDAINIFDSVIGDDDDEDETGVKKGVKNGNKKQDKPKPSASQESEEDEDDGDDDILSGVIDDDDDDKKTTANESTPEKNNESQKDDDDEDLLGVLDDEDDDDDDDEDEEKVSEVSQTSTSTQIPEEKPESNLVDSDEEGATEIDEVTDYESEENKLESTTTMQTTVTSTEVTKELEGNEKSASATLEVKDEDEDDSENTDLEIEGDIGLGGDDEERQIKKIRQIVDEAKRGRAPANWSIFLRPGRRFGSEPAPAPGSARGDRSSRVHRRMNLERIS